jgi:hypothetical protein
MSWGRRGQSTIELALTLPFIMGLLTLTLQGGVVISDQVNLEHFAYSGAQWAISQNGAATPDQIRNYIANAMCTGVGSTASPPSPLPGGSGASKFCQQQPSGVPQPSLAPPAGVAPLVSVSWGTVSVVPPPGLHGPIADAYAASCTVQNWGLDASMSPTTVWAGGQGGNPGSATITVTFHSGSPSGNPGYAWPIVTLSGGPWPPGLTPQTPQITPSQITPTGAGAPAGFASTATVTLNTSSLTPPGVYNFSITGTDQCGNGPNQGKTALTLTVNGTPWPTPSVSTLPTITGVNPPSVCAATATAISILGTGFSAGMLVNIGSLALSGTSVVNANTISGTTSASLAPGVYNVTVLSSSGNVLATAAGAITAALNCPTPTASSTASSCGTATVGAGSTSPVEAIITITWYESLSIPVLTGSSYLTLTARQVVLCQSPPRPTPSP